MTIISTLYQDLPLTVFPSEGIDTFVQYLNITVQDAPYVEQYVEAMNVGNQTLANQILQQIPSATQKIIQSADLNQMTQAILALERFYGTDVEGYIQTQQEDWEATINQFEYKGTWASGSSYVQNNIVDYTVSGLKLLYIALSNVPSGTLPTNTTYWRQLTVQGATGLTGDGLSYRGEWNNTSTYAVNDAVTRDNAIYMATVANTNRDPVSNPDYWQVVVPFQTTTYPIQAEQPTNQNVNELWFNTSDNPTNYYWLAELTNPADENQILQGYEAYNATGELITGALEATLKPTKVLITLTTSGWSNKTQTVTVNGVSSDESTQFICPVPVVASQEQYMAAGVYCSNQTTNSLTFTCNIVPIENISLYILIWEV